VGIKVFDWDNSLVVWLSSAKAPEDVTKIALESLRRERATVALFYPSQSPEINRQVVRIHIPCLRRKEGIIFFDPRPHIKRIRKLRRLSRWERISRRMREVLRLPHVGDEAYLQEIFWMPLLQSGLIEVLCLTEDWESFAGAVWYHDRALEYRIRIKKFGLARKASV